MDISPSQDDPTIGADPTSNNDFRFAFGHDAQAQARCPFAAHIRKTNPRADLEDFPGVPNGISTEPRRIIRSGIAFGPEVSAAEAASAKTSQERGLLFVSYSSNIPNTFKFIQQSKSR